MAFRAYTTKEVRDAAQAYGVNPDFAEAVYAVESSRGTNPKAMTARSVKQKRGSTFVRGPFQLEDATTADLVRENGLGAVNVDDPDVHLDLAMRQMRKLQDRYDGDLVKMAQAYLGGPGGVGTNTRDELGTSTGDYSNKIVAEMRKLQGPPADVADVAAQLDPFTADMGGAIPADDMFGMPAMNAAPRMAPSNIERDPLGLPMYIAAATRSTDTPNDTSAGDLDRFVSSLVDEELQGKNFANAA